MEHGKKLAHFYGQIQRGDEQLKVFREIFGDLRALEAALDKYISALAFQSFVIDSSSADIHEKDFSARKLSRAESDSALAEYRMWNHDVPEALPLVDSAFKGDPNLGLVHEEKAFLAFHNGQDEEAAREFSRAFELDKQRYLSQFFVTMLAAQRQTPQQRDALRAALQQTLQINPQFAPAEIQLAILDLADGRDESAYAWSRKAESLEPSRAGYHLLSGEILLRLKKEKDAAELARFVADRWRGPDHNEAVALWNRVPPQSRPPDANVVVETQEQSQTVEGVLRSVTCEEKTKNIVLDSNGQSLTFHSKGRQLIGIPDTVWYGADHFDLCHHVVGMHAVVRYRPPVGTEYTGDWLSIELRDELPSPRDNLKEPIENKN
jgi:Tfp pilus assembly protein PilF